MLFLEEIWSRNFTNLFIAPIKISEIIISLVFTALIRTLIGLVPAILLTSPLFGISILNLGVPLFFLFLSLYIFGITLGLFVSSGLIRFGPSFENIAAKPAPGAKKKPGTITAAEFAKLQKSYTKYKQENTPHSFGGASSIARTTDYTKWDKFASGLDDEEVKSRPSATAGKDETGVPGETASALSDEQSRFWMKVTTVVLSFGISVTVAYTFGIESTFVKQVMFGISAVIIFNFLLQKENARIIRTSNTLSMEEQEKKKK